MKVEPVKVEPGALFSELKKEIKTFRVSWAITAASVWKSGSEKGHLYSQYRNSRRSKEKWE